MAQEHVHVPTVNEKIAQLVVQHKGSVCHLISLRTESAMKRWVSADLAGIPMKALRHYV
jgi:hypothetical protein